METSEYSARFSAVYCTDYVLGFHSVFTLDLEELLPPQFVSFSRLLLSPTHEWGKLREKGRPPKPKLDDMTGNVMKRVLEKRIGMYPTTIEVRALRESFPQIMLNTSNRRIPCSWKPTFL